MTVEKIDIRQILSGTLIDQEDSKVVNILQTLEDKKRIEQLYIDKKPYFFDKCF